jgi:hypothetical protein
VTGLAAGPAAANGSDRCNWGELTRGAVPLGSHSSDPGGDGTGPGDDQPRVGLANVVNKGDLHATCEFLEGL